MSPSDLEDLCISAYGASNWTTKLASDIGVSERTVQRWAKGEYPILERMAILIRLTVKNRVEGGSRFYSA